MQLVRIYSHEKIAKYQSTKMNSRPEEEASTESPVTNVAVNIIQRNGIPFIAAAAVSRCAEDTKVTDLLGRDMQSEGKDKKSQGRIELFEFSDNAQYSFLDAFLTQVGQASLFIPEEAVDPLTADGRKVVNMLESFRQMNLEVVPLKRSCFSKKSDNAMATVMQLVGNVTSHCTNTITTEMPLALGCIECLAQQVNLMTDVNEGTILYTVSYGALDAYMRLDSAAADAVNLLPKVDHPSQFGSLFGILNRCRTKQGSRLLDRWLRQPLLDVAVINERLDCVQLLLHNTVQRNELRDGPLKSMPDLSAIIAKLHKKRKQGSAGGLSELFRLYAFVRSVPSYGRILDELLAQDDYEGDGQQNEVHVEEVAKMIRRKFIQPLQQIQEKFSLFEQLVEHVVDLDALPELRVNASHDEELLDIAEELSEVEANAERVYEEARGIWASFADVKLEVDSPHGIIMRTTRGDDERQLRQRNAKVRVISILKNGVHFTVPALEELSTRRQDLRSIYQRKQQCIVDQCVDTALTYIPLIEAVSAVVAELDVLVAFATATSLSPSTYCRPVLAPRGKGVLQLKRARHPCVELMDTVPQFIANDYDFNRDLCEGTEDSHFFELVTGPNMGGKSTYIRAVGCVMVLAQVGMFVPCDEAVVSPVDCILARVGAGDAVQKGVSTFMAEMLESSVILQTATQDSLVIIDELGRGTSTFDGFGIAWAISDYLIRHTRCLTLFATHFHELTGLQIHHPNAVANRHVSAHIDQSTEQMVLLYEVANGACTKSFGIHVAKTAGFPQHVIDCAKRKATALERIGNNEVEDESLKQQRDAKKRCVTQFAEWDLSSAKDMSMDWRNEFQSKMRSVFPPLCT